MKQLRYTSRARSDLTELALYIARDDRAAAENMIVRIEKACARLADYPHLGRSREDLRPGYRSLPVRPYVVLYRVQPDCVQVVRVLHGARDLRELT